MSTDKTYIYQSRREFHSSDQSIAIALNIEDISLVSNIIY